MTTKAEICISTKTRQETTEALIKKLVDEDSEIITLFYGKDVNEKELEKIIKFIKKTNADIEVETVNGKQDIYSFIIAVE